MSALRTPSKRSTSMGSSFASCFGASTPLSPRRLGGHGLLGDDQAYVNYRRLGFDDEEGPALEEEDKGERYEHAAPSREHLSMKVKDGRPYASEGEEHPAREKTVNMKMRGERWSKRENSGMRTHYALEAPSRVEEPSASEQEDKEDGRERRSTRTLAKLWSLREKNTISAAEIPDKQREWNYPRVEEVGGGGEAGGWARERKGVMHLVKVWTKREEARREVQCAAPEEEIGHQHPRMREREEGMTPRRQCLSRKVKEVCVQVLESAKRSSPHLSEIFVGNQLLMQVTSSSFVARRAAKNLSPSGGFIVAADPLLLDSNV